jgi:hypothetical protein
MERLVKARLVNHAHPGVILVVLLLLASALLVIPSVVAPAAASPHTLSTNYFLDLIAPNGNCVSSQNQISLDNPPVERGDAFVGGSGVLYFCSEAPFNQPNLRMISITATICYDECLGGQHSVPFPVQVTPMT